MLDKANLIFYVKANQFAYKVNHGSFHMRLAFGAWFALSNSLKACIMNCTWNTFNSILGHTVYSFIPITKTNGRKKKRPIPRDSAYGF